MPDILSWDMRRIPEERPIILVILHTNPRCAIECFACSVRRSVIAIVLVILFEDGERLFAGARVLAAFRGLDCFANLYSCVRAHVSQISRYEK
jgi:hypothetical protein